MAGSDVGDAGSHEELDPVLLEDLGRVGMRLVGEHLEQGMAVVDEGTLARGASAGNSWAIVVLIISDRAPATSTAVGPPPTMTKSSAPASARRASRSASSNAWMTRVLSRSASSSE